MNNWKKINCIIILVLAVLTGIKYYCEYLDLIGNQYLPDGARFFFVAFSVGICHFVLLLISIRTKNYSSAILDLCTGLAQTLVIGLRGKAIPYYGMFMSASVILIICISMIIQFVKKRKLSTVD